MAGRWIAGTSALSLLLLGGCAYSPPLVDSDTEDTSSAVSTDFDLRILDSLGKPPELTRFQKKETGLFTQGGFEVDYYSPTLEGASTECQAIADAKDLAVYAGGNVEDVKTAIHPVFREIEDIYGYKYVLENYPGWDSFRDGIIPDDFADLHVHIALVTFPSLDGPQRIAEFLSTYAEPCNLSQSSGNRSRIEPDNELTFFRIYNYLGLETEVTQGSGNFYFVWQESSRTISSKFPNLPETQAYFGVDRLIGVYSDDVLFLSYYDFWDKDARYLGITTDEIDSAIFSVLEDLNPSIP